MSLRIIVSSPPGFPSPHLVRAAHDADTVGLLGLEYSDGAESQRALDDLVRSNVQFLVSVRTLESDVRDRLLPAVGRGLTGIAISRPSGPRLQSEVQWIHDRGIRALVEITTLEDALAAEAAGADELIVKGNESGGAVGEETTFILVQRVLPRVSIPVYARGGIGLRSAAACLAAGVTGVVLDWQFALCEEADVPDAVRSRIARMDGSETAVLGQTCGVKYRVYARPGESAYAELRTREDQEGLLPDGDRPALESWRAAVDLSATSKQLLLIGQDACFASALSARHRTVAGICRAIQKESLRQCRVAVRLDALGENSPLAASHGTRFPIVQGPMTRVSDRAEFARAVADGGGLPFLALALMKGPEVGALLDKTKTMLGPKPWGVGILGFVPQELRAEQLAEVRRYSPSFAIVAGGRPDQARELEQNGTHCYLHVPSPELLRSFLEGGARRFVFEGRECGGHVGPRTSFVLWDSMIDVILKHLQASGDARTDQYHVLFAGGIHDARSAAMVAALAAPLAERGVRIGALLGTAYLFTREAVETGAIQPGFQHAAVACADTILLESGVGHATRCAATAFGRQFAEEKRRLVRQGSSKDDIREALEMLNLGRLRVAAKGIGRGAPNADGSPTYVQVDEQVQHREGMYMIGQVAALRDDLVGIEALHRDVSHNATVIAANTTGSAKSPDDTKSRQNPGVAIVGLACVFPKAGTPDEYWHNILAKTNAITEIPKERWDADLYFDTDRRARDRIYSKWGGFLEDIEFDPVRYGMPPNALSSVDPLQLVTLEICRRALDDAGYADRRFDRDRTSVIVGTGGGVGELGLAYGFRSEIPHFLAKAGRAREDADRLIEDLSSDWLPEWTEDSFAGTLLNVAAGRVANRFDLGGTNYVVDAACATSLAAVRLAATELETRSSNVAIAVGADTTQTAFGYLCFSKTQALSPTGQCRTFDESADGIVISEGVAVAIFKRLDDAIRDGDRIYAVLRGVGASSDGKDKGLTAPRPIGQIRALERAYEHADLPPASVELVEAHGTGTVVGDRTEIEALTTFFSRAGSEPQSCALGSVKSMIGHTKCTAGFAGLVKAALALHRQVLPPTIGVTTPNSRASLSESPFYLNTDARPWFKRLDGLPRRAGVSAFGFGGTNFHAVLEEYRGDSDVQPALEDWPAELLVWRGAAAKDVAAAVDSVAAALRRSPKGIRLGEAAASVCWEHGRAAGNVVLAVVATSIDDLLSKLDGVKSALASGADLKDPRGVYLSVGSRPSGKIAFLFPGQGSQRLNMLGDLALAIPSFRAQLERADEVLGPTLGRRLTSYIFPRPVFDDAQRKDDEAALTDTRVAQPALGAVDLAMARWLGRLGVVPDMAGGHSYGELAALCAAGAISFEDLLRVSEARGRSITDGARGELGTMAAIDGPEASVTDAIAGVDGVYLANVNAPAQTVISGTKAGVEEALRRLAERGISGKPLPVAAAFHSPLIAGARSIFGEALARYPFISPRFTVYSNTTASPHSDDPETIRHTLVEHLLSPVRFADEIRAMHDAGARIFVEVGPGRVLTGLAGQTLAGREFIAIATDQGGRNGLVQMVHALGQLATSGVRLNLQSLFEGRAGAIVPLATLVHSTTRTPSATTWIISAGRATPLRPQTATNGRREPGNDGSRATSSQLSRPAPTPPNRTVTPAEHQAKTVTAPAIRPPAAVEGNGRASGGDGSSASVMNLHHRLMSKFLETHRNVMLASLGAVEPAFVPDVQTVAVVQVPDSHPAPIEVVADTVPASEPTPAPQPTTLLTIENVTHRLVELVSERTGYPAEMLGLDLDLEADLGVDSIKRVEILNALQNEQALTDRVTEIEGLSKLKTLRAIAEWIVSPPVAAAQTAESRPVEGVEGVEGVEPVEAVEAVEPLEARVTALPPSQPVRQERTDTRREAPVLPRMLVTAVDAPAVVGEPAASVPAGVAIIVDDDGRGTAGKVRARLVAMGMPADVVSIAAAAEAVALIDAARKQHGRLAALIHLAPLAGDPPATSEAFFQRLDRELMPLFHLSRAMETDLRASRGVVMAATRLGGAFGVDAPQDFWPGSGAVAGFTKTLAREWPEVSCRTIDFERHADADQIADAIVRELTARDGLVEVGYQASRRLTLAPVPAPLASDQRIDLDADSVVLVTGGARGITAEVAVELAERFRPQLVLVGRSPLESSTEPPEIAACAEARELKKALIDRRRRAGEPLQVAAIEEACKRILRVREMHANVARMRAAGSDVSYHAVDVSNASEFGRFIDGVYAKHGRIDGVIHGAGIIEDKFVRDKSEDSFRRVMRPKVSGALTLVDRLRPDRLKFLALFSSVSARYGNRGQCDYAAANEILNKLAVSLTRRWPGRVVSINWGPWESANGMVGAELAERFAEAGVSLIARADGRRAFVEELLHGDQTDAEVVWGGPLPQVSRAQQTHRASPAPPLYPLLASRPSARESAHGSFEAVLESGPDTEIFLKDHVLDGTPVMPAAVALELIAEVAASVSHDRVVTGVSDFRVLQGITYPQSGRRRLRIKAVDAPGGRDRGAPGRSVSVSIASTDDRPVVHYRANVEVGLGLEEPPAVEPLRLGGSRRSVLSADELYRQWLFHGPTFAGIKAVTHIGDGGIVGTLRPSLPSGLLGGAATGSWLVDPVVIDSGLQLLIVWARTYLDVTPLPSRLRRYHRYAAAFPSTVVCEAAIDHRPPSATLTCQLRFFDEDRRLLGWLEEMEVTCSRALNRLAASAGV